MISLKFVDFKNCVFVNLIKKIIISGIEGELGIYPKHTQLLTIIKPSLVTIFYNKNKIKKIYVLGGILEVQPKEIIIVSDLTFSKKEKKKKIKKLKNTFKKIKKKKQKLSSYFLKFSKLFTI